MKPIKQKNIHNPEKGIQGDCLRACICSLLEISDEGVPNFVEDKQYPVQLVNFLKEKGFRLRWVEEEPKDIEYYMAFGTGPRGFRHAVIYSKGKLVHDPHPEGGGLMLPDLYVLLEKREVS